MSASPVTAFVGLGSNLDQPLQQVRSGLQVLRDLPAVQLLARSSLYRSQPLGPPGQPDYINAVAMLRTRLPAEDLLDCLQAIEAAHGRQRGVRWAARTLDLDLLLFGDRQIDTERLQVPHPELLNRNFVVLPLLEIAPQLVLPGIGPLAAQQARLGVDGIERLVACSDD